jgi:hypothetical protein
MHTLSKTNIYNIILKNAQRLLLEMRVLFWEIYEEKKINRRKYFLVFLVLSLHIYIILSKEENTTTTKKSSIIINLYIKHKLFVQKISSKQKKKKKKNQL